MYASHLMLSEQIMKKEKLEQQLSNWGVSPLGGLGPMNTVSKLKLPPAGQFYYWRPKNNTEQNHFMWTGWNYL